MNPFNYVHLIFHKGTKNTQWRKDSLFNKCWETWISACRKLKLDPCLSPHTNIYSKWIKDLNIKPETLKVVQERAWNALEIIGRGNGLLSRTQMAKIEEASHRMVQENVVFIYNGILLSHKE
jgi:hypothetical protein